MAIQYKGNSVAKWLDLPLIQDSFSVDNQAVLCDLHQVV